jgi:hypothetical protein
VSEIPTNLEMGQAFYRGTQIVSRLLQIIAWRLEGGGHSLRLGQKGRTSDSDDNVSNTELMQPLMTTDIPDSVDSSAMQQRSGTLSADMK